MCTYPLHNCHSVYSKVVVGESSAFLLSILIYSIELLHHVKYRNVLRKSYYSPLPMDSAIFYSLTNC